MKKILKVFLVSFILSLLYVSPVFALTTHTGYGYPIMMDDKTIDERYATSATGSKSVYYFPGIRIYQIVSGSGTCPSGWKSYQLSGGYFYYYDIQESDVGKTLSVGSLSLKVNMPIIEQAKMTCELDDASLQNYLIATDWVVGNYDPRVIAIKWKGIDSNIYMPAYFYDTKIKIYLNWGGQKILLEKTGLFNPSNRTMYYGFDQKINHPEIVPPYITVEPDPSTPPKYPIDMVISSPKCVFFDEDVLDVPNDGIATKFHFGVAGTGSTATTWSKDTKNIYTYTITMPDGSKQSNKTGEFSYDCKKPEVFKATMEVENMLGAKSKYEVYIRGVDLKMVSIPVLIDNPATFTHTLNAADVNTLKVKQYHNKTKIEGGVVTPGADTVTTSSAIETKFYYTYNRILQPHTEITPATIYKTTNDWLPTSKLPANTSEHQGKYTLNTDYYQDCIYLSIDSNKSRNYIRTHCYDWFVDPHRSKDDETTMTHPTDTLINEKKTW